MQAEVVKAQWRRDVNEVTEDAATAGEASYPAYHVRFDTFGDELNQKDLSFRGWRSKHAQSPVPGTGLIARHLNDSLEDGWQIQVGRDRENRVENLLYLAHRRSVTRATNELGRPACGVKVPTMDRLVRPPHAGSPG
jgi:hypothetical protein